MSPADSAHRLTNPYAQAVQPDGSGRPARVAGRALTVGALGLGAVTVFAGTGLAVEETPAREDTAGEVVPEASEEVEHSWAGLPRGLPSDPNWEFTDPHRYYDSSVGGWVPGIDPAVVDGGVGEVPREGGVPAEEVPVIDSSHRGPEVEIAGEPTAPSGRPDPRPLHDRLAQWQDRLAQWQERGGADRDGGPLVAPDGPVEVAAPVLDDSAPAPVPVGSDVEVPPVLSVDDATAGDSSDGTTGPGVLGWAVSPRYTWEQIVHMRENGIPFERLPGSEMPPRSDDDKDDRPRILGGSATPEEPQQAPSRPGSDAESAP